MTASAAPELTIAERAQAEYMRRGHLVAASLVPLTVGQNIPANHPVWVASNAETGVSCHAWRVLGPATREEFLDQVMCVRAKISLTALPYYYKLEAAD